MGLVKKANAPVVTINGVNISIDDTIQTLLDNGLVLSSVGGGTIDCSEHTLEAMTYNYDGYEISINNPDGNNIDTNLVVTLYNPTNSEKNITNVKLLHLHTGQTGIKKVIVQTFSMMMQDISTKFRAVINIPLKPTVPMMMTIRLYL